MEEEKQQTPPKDEKKSASDAGAQKQSPPEKKEGEVKKAHFSSLTSEEKESKPLDINFLMDISLRLSIELGRTVLSVRDILSLKDGAVVELNKLAGEPVDIFVNDKMIARGEVVVIDDNFGVRVTDILTPSELLQNLRETNNK